MSLAPNRGAILSHVPISKRNQTKNRTSHRSIFLLSFVSWWRFALQIWHGQNEFSGKNLARLPLWALTWSALILSASQTFKLQALSKIGTSRNGITDILLLNPNEWCICFPWGLGDVSFAGMSRQIEGSIVYDAFPCGKLFQFWWILISLRRREFEERRDVNLSPISTGILPVIIIYLGQQRGSIWTNYWSPCTPIQAFRSSGGVAWQARSPNMTALQVQGKARE